MSNPTCTPDECLNKGPRGGLCKSCWNARALLSYYENRDERNAYNREWRANNAQRVKENFARWYQENKDRQKLYYLSRREHVRKYYRERRAANPGMDSKYSREWRKRNPERWALKNRANANRRRAADKRRVDYELILQEHGMVCHICSEDIAGLDDLHMDHVIPLSRGGQHNESNIKPSHALCNLRKGSKVA